jgi:TIR domain-containing protein
MIDLFVSYSRRSQDEVGGLLQDLSALGGALWFDEEPRNGQFAWEQTLSRIRACDVLLFALTKGSLESEACWRQASYAQALMKPVLGVLLGEGVDMNAIPASLRTQQLVDYRRPDRGVMLSLLEVLRAFGKARALPRGLPPPPAPPPPDLTRLRERINSGRKLATSDQTALIEELGQEVRDLRSSLEARQLLLSLRQRRDVSPSVIVQIDALLRKTAATQMKLRTPSWQEAAAFRASQAASPGARAPSDRQASRALRQPASPRPAPRRAALALRAGLSQQTAITLGGLVLGGAVSWLCAWGLREGGLQAIDMGSLELRGWQLYGLGLHGLELHGGELIGLLVVAAALTHALRKGSVTRALLGTLVGVLALILGVVFYE